MSDWMNKEISNQRESEERKNERYRRESETRSQKYNQMKSAASPKITLLKKIASEFVNQTGYKSNVYESQKY